MRSTQEVVDSCYAHQDKLVSCINQEDEDQISLADVPLISSVMVSSPAMNSIDRNLSRLDRYLDSN